MHIRHEQPATPETLRSLARRNQRIAPTTLDEDGVVYEPITVQTILTRNPNPDLRHYWSINPYRGCQFGCTYCFARYTAKFIELHDPRQFERRIYYKHNAPDLAARLRDRDFNGRPVLLGTATDPWQPAERRLCITRGILQALLRYPSLDLFCLTKSSLIRRDADLLGRLAQSGRPVAVGFSITTLDEALARKMEPQAASPSERLKAMRILSEAGVTTGLMLMPVLPGLTDSDDSLAAVLAAALAYGATFARAGTLHLRSDPKRRFFSWIEEEMPALARRYHGIYDYDAYAPAGYREALKEKVERLKQRLGYRAWKMEHPQPCKAEQLRLEL